MIQDIKELSTSLRYIATWTDKLEGLRQHSEKTENALLSTTSAGPLAEVRRVLLESREFVDSMTEETNTEAVDYRLPVNEGQKVA